MKITYKTTPVATIHLKMKKPLLILLLLSLPFVGLAQFESRKYVCQSPNGIIETIWTEPIPGEQGYERTDIYYQSSKNKQKIQLIVKEKSDDKFPFSVQFPGEKQWYHLGFDEYTKLFVKDPKGKVQIFEEEIEEENFTVYVCKSPNNIVEKLFVNYIYAVGDWRAIEYNSSKNPKRLRLEMIRRTEDNRCVVKFPQIAGEYVLELQMDMEDISKLHQIICLNPDGSKQLFVAER